MFGMPWYYPVAWAAVGLASVAALYAMLIGPILQEVRIRGASVATFTALGREYGLVFLKIAGVIIAVDLLVVVLGRGIFGH